MCGDGVGMMGIVNDEGFPPESLPADLGYPCTFPPPLHFPSKARFYLVRYRHRQEEG